jgi:hypothetical protein
VTDNGGMSAPGSEPSPPGGLPTRGRVRVGPRPLRRVLPLWLVGGSVVALVLSGFAADTWRSVGVGLPLVLGHVVGWATLMVVLLALAWLVLGRETALVVDLDARTLHRRTPGSLLERGRRETRPLADLRTISEDPDGDALLEVRADGEDEPEVWSVPHVGWDDASWDGLRALQAAADLPVAPPLAEARHRVRRAVEIVHQREAAAAVALPWRAEYDDDPEAFRRAYDARRQELAARPGGRRRHLPRRAVRPGR